MCQLRVLEGAVGLLPSYLHCVTYRSPPACSIASASALGKLQRLQQVVNLACVRCCTCSTAQAQLPPPYRASKYASVAAWCALSGTISKNWPLRRALPLLSAG